MVEASSTTPYSHQTWQQKGNCLYNFLKILKLYCSTHFCVYRDMQFQDSSCYRGGNKGIGLEICKKLASSAVVVVLTANDQKRGTEAGKGLKSSGLSDVVFHQLDVTDP